MLTSLSALHVVFVFFFFNDPATTEIYTLSLHDALPISQLPGEDPGALPPVHGPSRRPGLAAGPRSLPAPRLRSEEHTSELQSHSDLVCRLLLEKKKKKTRVTMYRNQILTADTSRRHATQ